MVTLKRLPGLLIGLLLVGTAVADESTAPAAIHPDSGGEGWVSLFGEALENARYSPEVWSVKDGVLTATKDRMIWSLKKWGDYILDLEFKTAEGTNSGVVVRCSDREKWIPNSLEIQIADDFSEKWKKSDKTWQCAAVFGRLAATASAVHQPGEWNHYTITCKGPIIEVVLNGRKVTVMDTRKWTDPAKNPDGSDIPKWLSKPAAEMEATGYIGLQGKHAGAPIWFRNIRIKALD